MIKFLKDRDTDERSFKAGETVDDLSPESEFGHVRRGFAGFVGEDGSLTDHDGKPIVEAAAEPKVKPAGARRTLPRRAVARAGSAKKGKKKPAAKKPAR